MAIAIRGTTPATATATTASVSVTLTGSRQPQTGDLLLIIHGNNYYQLSNMPSVTVGGSTTGVTAITGTGFPADGGNLFGHIKAYTYVAASTGDLTVAVTETGSADEEKTLAVYVLSGADTANPIDAAAGSFESASASTSHVAPSVSPSSSDAFLVCHVNDAGGANSGASTPPPGMTEAYDTNFDTFYSCSGAYLQLSASGATGTKTFTESANVFYVSASFAVKTASGGGSTSANAENTAGTGAAQAPTASAAPDAGTTAGAGAANDGQNAVTVNADVATGAGDAPAPTAAAGASPEASAATGAAGDPSAAATATPATANAVGLAATAAITGPVIAPGVLTPSQSGPRLTAYQDTQSAPRLTAYQDPR